MCNMCNELEINATKHGTLIAWSLIIIFVFGDFKVWGWKLCRNYIVLDLWGCTHRIMFRAF